MSINVKDNKNIFITIVGKCATGKTKLAKYLLEYLANFEPVCICLDITQLDTIYNHTVLIDIDLRLNRQLIDCIYQLLLTNNLKIIFVDMFNVREIILKSHIVLQTYQNENRDLLFNIIKNRYGVFEGAISYDILLKTYFRKRKIDKLLSYSIL